MHSKQFQKTLMYPIAGFHGYKNKLRHSILNTILNKSLKYHQLLLSMQTVIIWWMATIIITFF